MAILELFGYILKQDLLVSTHPHIYISACLYKNTRNDLPQVSGGNLTDEEVCGKLAESWMQERLNSNEGFQVHPSPFKSIQVHPSPSKSIQVHPSQQSQGEHF